MSLLLRSIIFNIIFYLVMVAYLLAMIPTLVLPRRSVIVMAQHWAKTNLFLLRVICGIKVEWIGLEKIPRGPLICAAKHQSLWETFALLPLFDDPIFIIKRELLWIPFFGWFAWRGGMIPVDRGKGSKALTAMTERARDEIRSGRQLVIFPEGTRRAPGAEPAYKFGVAHLYGEVGVPVLPVALNSGLFWRRRSFLRYPGTVRVMLLDPIMPGALDKTAFFQTLQDEIEGATATLVAEGERELKAVA